MNVDTLIIDAEAMKLTMAARCTVAAASGVEVLELGTGTLRLRARNATTLAEQQKARDAASVAAPEEAING